MTERRTPLTTIFYSALETVEVEACRAKKRQRSEIWKAALENVTPQAGG